MVLDDINTCQSTGILPKADVFLLSTTNYKITSISEYDGHPLEPNEILTCKDPVYVMPVSSTNSVFTFDDKGCIGTHSIKSNTFVISFFRNNKEGKLVIEPDNIQGLKFLQDEYYKNKTRDNGVTPVSNKEEFRMPDVNPMDLLQQRIASSQGQVNNAQGAAGTNAQAAPSAPKMSRSQKREQRDQERSQFEGRIRQMTSGVKASISDDVTAFNQKYGSLLGYVTGNDAKINFAISKMKPKTDASTAVQGAATEYKITVRQGKPSKPKAVIFTIPEVTYKSLDELSEHREDYTMSALAANVPTTITLIESADVAHRIISLYFKGTIAENAELWNLAGHGGEQGRVECGYKQRVSRKGSNMTDMHSYMKAYRDSGITSQLVDWNYIPLKIYKTIEVSNAALPEEDLRKLTDTVYRPLQSNGGAKGSKDDATTKFNRLAPYIRSYFHENNDGTVSVDYFKRDTTAFASLMSVKKFWSPRGADFIAAENGRLAIAYKEDIPSSKGDKPPRFQYATISILDDNGGVIFDKFRQFVNFVGENTLNQESLKPFARRTASKKTESGVIRGAAAQKLALGELNGSLMPASGIQMETLNNLSESIEASRERARISLMQQITR